MEATNGCTGIVVMDPPLNLSPWKIYLGVKFPPEIWHQCRISPTENYPQCRISPTESYTGVSFPGESYPTVSVVEYAFPTG